jgi:hypothetical protein
MVSGAHRHVGSSHNVGFPEPDDLGSEESDQEHLQLEDSSAPHTSDSPLQTGLADLKDTLAEAARTRKLKQVGRPEKRRKRELDPAMDYLINAEKRAGLMCRRKVFDVCFENDAAGGKYFVVWFHFHSCFL